MAQSFTAHHRVDKSGECWLWLGAHDTNGYGNYRNRRLHVILWEEENGPVPEGLELDHLCRNTGCCRPSHMEAVTHEVNVQRALSLMYLGVCRKGVHEIKSAADVRRRGTRVTCRLCANEYMRGFKQRRRAAAK